MKFSPMTCDEYRMLRREVVTRYGDILRRVDLDLNELIGLVSRGLMTREGMFRSIEAVA